MFYSIVDIEGKEVGKRYHYATDIVQWKESSPVGFYGCETVRNYHTCFDNDFCADDWYLLSPT